MIVRWHSDVVRTQESVIPVCDKPYPKDKRKVQKADVLSVCDKPYHTNKLKVQKAEELEVLRICSGHCDDEFTLYCYNVFKSHFLRSE